MTSIIFILGAVLTAVAGEFIRTLIQQFLSQ